MTRTIINIEEDKCNGCGACAEACHEGAIRIINGKAQLIRDDYCDGLGNCLPVCPTGAIHFEVREAAAFDESAVRQNMDEQAKQNTLPCGCPGTSSRSIERDVLPKSTETSCSELSQWPVQIKLVPTSASYFDNANLLIAADCTAFAYGNFHHDFIRRHITLIGCPKLDMEDYSEKLTAIIKNNQIRSVKVVRMEVPCCGGIEAAVKTALHESGKLIPWQVVTITTDGQIIE